jgi:transcriptional regulator with XRE-family HTH domain
MPTNQGRSLARLDKGLAEDFGRRLLAARRAAGLTQSRLAGDRYTKAYISALEHGHAKPSMAALNFLAAQLGTSATRLLESEEPHWTRMEADLRLASGDWQRAVDGYTEMLDGETRAAIRAELQCGLAEAFCRLERPVEALPLATEAAAAFEAARRPADAALARYWQAYALYQRENDDEARSILRALADDVRAGQLLAPDFAMRVLVALAVVETRAGATSRALTYLDEARGLVGEMDQARRGTYLNSLAQSYRASGDFEAAIGAAHQALAAYRAVDADREVARMENELALVHLATGSIGLAREHAILATDGLARLGDDRMRANVVDSQAQIELAAGDLEKAAGLAAEAMAAADRTGNRSAAISAGLTLARTRRRMGQLGDATRLLEQTAGMAREYERPSELRDVLTEWADVLAETGDLAGAYERSREALQVGH